MFLMLAVSWQPNRNKSMIKNQLLKDAKSLNQYINNPKNIYQKTQSVSFLHYLPE